MLRTVPSTMARSAAISSWSIASPRTVAAGDSGSVRRIRWRENRRLVSGRSWFAGSGPNRVHSPGPLWSTSVIVFRTSEEHTLVGREGWLHHFHAPVAGDGWEHFHHPVGKRPEASEVFAAFQSEAAGLKGQRDVVERPHVELEGPDLGDIGLAELRRHRAVVQDDAHALTVGQDFDRAVRPAVASQRSISRVIDANIVRALSPGAA